MIFVTFFVVWISKMLPKLCALPQFNFHTLLNYIRLLTPVFHDCDMLGQGQTVQPVFSVVRGKHALPSRFLCCRNVFWANARCHLNSHIKVMRCSLGVPPTPPPPLPPPRESVCFATGYPAGPVLPGVGFSAHGFAPLAPRTRDLENAMREAWLRWCNPLFGYC